MQSSPKTTAEWLEEPVLLNEGERHALSTHLALARWLACIDPKVLAEMPSDVLLKADIAMDAAGEWLSAWQQIVSVAVRRVRTNLPDNVVVLDRSRTPKS